MEIAAEKGKFAVDTTCYHCGDVCREVLSLEGKSFCCQGCKTVYELLKESGLSNFYQLNASPGRSLRNESQNDLGFLDDEQVKEKLVVYSDEHISSVVFNVPAIHCSSCIYLLENFYRFTPGVTKSSVDFLRKELSLTFKNDECSLKKAAENLSAIGYAPHISLDDVEGKRSGSVFTTYYLKIAIAFFCFGNIMMLSFPEYLGIDLLSDNEFRKYFGYLNFFLSLPVMFYCSGEFFRSAYSAVSRRMVNLDVPIVLGIIVMFVRSSWEIFTGTGAGFMDTLASLVFLMLVGRLFQQKVYHRLAFDRDYKSYFPVAVAVLRDGKEFSTPVTQLKKGDRIAIRNNEIIPADCILIEGDGSIDYSFVTGESLPVSRRSGDKIYAGGKQVAKRIVLEVIKPVSQSYLTKLWNDENFVKERDDLGTLASKVSTGFTYVVIAIAVIGALYWLPTDKEKALNAFTSVLIITCPCALALSSPFTLGNALRILGRIKFYLKNGPVAEKLASADTIVFDKTGTITQSRDAEVKYIGEPLSREDLSMLLAIALEMNHPISQIIKKKFEGLQPAISDTFKELDGAGACARFGDIEVIAGSRALFPEINKRANGTAIYISVNGVVKGHFLVTNKYRDGFTSVIDGLKNKYKLIVLSGDNDAEKEYLRSVLPADAEVHFYQSPHDKLELVKKLRREGKKVLMIGDGLNDAGALKASNVGITISDDLNTFSPACDAILDAASFSLLPVIMKFAKACVVIILFSFLISFLYNVVGVYFALQGTMSPLVAAVIMPISSVTVILFTTISGNIAYKRIFKQEDHIS